MKISMRIEQSWSTARSLTRREREHLARRRLEQELAGLLQRATRAGGAAAPRAASPSETPRPTPASLRRGHCRRRARPPPAACIARPDCRPRCQAAGRRPAGPRALPMTASELPGPGPQAAARRPRPARPGHAHHRRRGRVPVQPRHRHPDAAAPGDDGEPGDRLEVLRLIGAAARDDQARRRARRRPTSSSPRPSSANQPVVQNGLLPALASLEALITPSADQLLATDALFDQGMLEIAPVEAPAGRAGLGQSSGSSRCWSAACRSPRRPSTRSCGRSASRRAWNSRC